MSRAFHDSFSGLKKITNGRKMPKTFVEPSGTFIRTARNGQEKDVFKKMSMTLILFLDASNRAPASLLDSVHRVTERYKKNAYDHYCIQDFDSALNETTSLLESKILKHYFCWASQFKNEIEYFFSSNKRRHFSFQKKVILICNKRSFVRVIGPKKINVKNKS